MRRNPLPVAPYAYKVMSEALPDLLLQLSKKNIDEANRKARLALGLSLRHLDKKKVVASYSIPLVDFVRSPVTGKVPPNIQRGLDVVRQDKKRGDQPLTVLLELCVIDVIAGEEPVEYAGLFERHEFKITLVHKHLQHEQSLYELLSVLEHELGHASQFIGSQLIRAAEGKAYFLPQKKSEFWTNYYAAAAHGTALKYDVDDVRFGMPPRKVRSRSEGKGADWRSQQSLRHGDRDIEYHANILSSINELGQKLVHAPFTGIGVIFVAVPELTEYLKLSEWLVDYTVMNSPAEQYGLKSLDIITSVDGWPTTGRETADVIARIVGPAGTEVEIGVLRGLSKRGAAISPISTTPGVDGLWGLKPLTLRIKRKPIEQTAAEIVRREIEGVYANEDRYSQDSRKERLAKKQVFKGLLHHRGIPPEPYESMQQTPKGTASPRKKLTTHQKKAQADRWADYGPPRSNPKKPVLQKIKTSVGQPALRKAGKSRLGLKPLSTSVDVYDPREEAVRAVARGKDWRIAVGHYKKTHSVPQIVQRSWERYQDVDHLIRGRQEYEYGLGVGAHRNYGPYRVTCEPTLNGLTYFVWPLPPGQHRPQPYRTEEQALAAVHRLNEEHIRPYPTLRERPYSRTELLSWLPPESVFKERDGIPSGTAQREAKKSRS